ncbi:hypothetical protein GOV11_03545 [Candidatus Woesearchaeota archaeon]|nr:hypothetical protein [Candidatus Woesearchaeota archaeon]
MGLLSTIGWVVGSVVAAVGIIALLKYLGVFDFFGVVSDIIGHITSWMPIWLKRTIFLLFGVILLGFMVNWMLTMDKVCSDNKVWEIDNIFYAISAKIQDAELNVDDVTRLLDAAEEDESDEALGEFGTLVGRTRDLRDTCRGCPDWPLNEDNLERFFIDIDQFNNPEEYKLWLSRLESGYKVRYVVVHAPLTNRAKVRLAENLGIDEVISGSCYMIEEEYADTFADINLDVFYKFVTNAEGDGASVIVDVKKWDLADCPQEATGEAMEALLLPRYPGTVDKKSVRTKDYTTSGWVVGSYASVTNSDGTALNLVTRSPRSVFVSRLAADNKAVEYSNYNADRRTLSGFVKKDVKTLTYSCSVEAGKKDDISVRIFGIDLFNFQMLALIVVLTGMFSVLKKMNLM